MGARPGRQLQHGVRLPESEPCAGARSSPSARRTASSRARPIADSRRTSIRARTTSCSSVNVPKDWDRKKELVWTVVANGKTEPGARDADGHLGDRSQARGREQRRRRAGQPTSLILRDQPPVDHDRGRRHARPPGTPVTITRERDRRWDSAASGSRGRRARPSRRSARRGRRRRSTCRCRRNRVRRRVCR